MEILTSSHVGKRRVSKDLLWLYFATPKNPNGGVSGKDKEWLAGRRTRRRNWSSLVPLTDKRKKEESKTGLCEKTQNLQPKYWDGGKKFNWVAYLRKEGARKYPDCKGTTRNMIECEKPRISNHTVERGHQNNASF